MNRRSWQFWVGLVAPSALILAGAAVIAAGISYNRAYNNAFSSCDALTIAEDAPRSDFGFRWVPPGFECVLYDDDGRVIRHERV